MAATISSLVTPPTPYHQANWNSNPRPSHCVRLAVGTASLRSPAVGARAGRRGGAAVALVASASASAALESPEELAARKLYVGNIPRTVTSEELERIFSEHGSVERAEVMYDKYTGRSRRFGFVTMSTVDDASAAIEKLNETEIGGRKIKVNATENFLPNIDPSAREEESIFVDSQYKVYVGNLAKTVTTQVLKDFFSEKGQVLSAMVCRIPGTSKSRGYGFVTFSSEEEVEAAVSSFNDTKLEGQMIRVNKA